MPSIRLVDAVAQIGKNDRAVGDGHAIDRDRAGVALAGGRHASRRRNCAARSRSRSNGTVRTGRSMTSSVISGWPDHRLASVMSAWMLPMVRRSLLSRSFGSCSVTSFRVTFSDGQTPILVAPAIVSRYPVSRSTRAWIARGQETGGNPDDQHEPGDDDDGGDGGAGDFQCSHDGIPTRANSVNSGCAIPDVADGLSLSRKGQTAQRSLKIIRGCCKVM